jgi:hypothetical protein
VGKVEKWEKWEKSFFKNKKKYRKDWSNTKKPAYAGFHERDYFV